MVYLGHWRLLFLFEIVVAVVLLLFLEGSVFHFLDLNSYILLVVVAVLVEIKVDVDGRLFVRPSVVFDFFLALDSNADLNAGVAFHTA
jgi:hypothetical protein